MEARAALSETKVIFCIFCFYTMCDNTASPKYIFLLYFFNLWLLYSLPMTYLENNVDFCSVHLTELDEIKHMRVIYKL